MGVKFWGEVRTIFVEILLEEEVSETRGMAITILPEVVRIMETNFEDCPTVFLELVKSITVLE